MEDSATYRYVIEKGRLEGRQEGIEAGRLEGQAEGRRRAILDLVSARLAEAPERLEERLSSLDAEALQCLFSQLLRAADGAELEALLPK